MKKAILTVAFGLFLSISASAQQGRMQNASPEERAEMMTKRMKKELDLNEDQYKKILAIHTQKAKANGGNREGMREQKKEEKEAYKAEMKAILNAEQYAAFEAKAAERREKMKKEGTRKRRG
jgi:periplasmic protein CpxP/Spy